MRGEDDATPVATSVDRSAAEIEASVASPSRAKWSCRIPQAFRLGRRFRVPLAIVLSAALLIAGWTPQLAPTNAYAFDKIAHFAAFGGLTLLMALLFDRPALVALAATALSGVIELGQQFIPGRSAGWDDFLANVVGILVALGLAWALKRKRVVGGVA